MHTTNCLNCNSDLTGKFCHECGQKSDTHRITAKHFFLHDLVHGVWHLDKGIPFTIKETFTRPGYAARDYIAGKRIKYYNVFYLILLVFGLVLFLGNYVEGGVVGSPSTGDEARDKLIELLSKYVKFFYLLLIPIMAASGHFIFRRLKLNFFEHCIISGIIFLGMLHFLLAGILLSLVDNVVVEMLNSCIGIACALFPAFVYYQASRSGYRFWEYMWRIVVFYGLIIGFVAAAVKYGGILLLKYFAG